MKKLHSDIKQVKVNIDFLFNNTSIYNTFQPTNLTVKSTVFIKCMPFSARFNMRKLFCTGH